MFLLIPRVDSDLTEVSFIFVFKLVEAYHFTTKPHHNIFTRVQAENEKKSPSTFPKGFDPRIDLAAFFQPPGIVFTYHPGLLARLHKNGTKQL